MSFKVEVKIGDLRIDEIKALVGKALNEAIEEYGRQVLLQRALELVPVKEGKLKASLKFTLSPEKHNGWLVSGGAAAPHAHLVEYGTIHAKEHSFMRRGADQTKGRLPPIIAEKQEKNVR